MGEPVYVWLATEWSFLLLPAVIKLEPLEDFFLGAAVVVNLPVDAKIIRQQRMSNTKIILKPTQHL
jgi:hypothetical protein